MPFKYNPFTDQLDVVQQKPVTTGLMVFGETPTPATDGAQTVFTVANAYVSGTLRVYKDKLRQELTTDFTETTSTTFTMTAAPDADEDLRVDYVKQ